MSVEDALVKPAADSAEAAVEPCQENTATAADVAEGACTTEQDGLAAADELNARESPSMPVADSAKATSLADPTAAANIAEVTSATQQCSPAATEEFGVVSAASAICAEPAETHDGESGADKGIGNAGGSCAVCSSAAKAPCASDTAPLAASALGDSSAAQALASESSTTFQCPERRPRSATEPDPGSQAANQQNHGQRASSELDVAKRDAVLQPKEALPGMVAHTVGSIVGGATLGAGWVIGKADVAVGRHGGLPVPGLGGAKQVSDSGAFKLGFRAMLYANGIMPTVLVEKGPYGNDLGPLPQDPDARKRLLRATPLLLSNHVSYLDALVLPLVLEVPKLMSMAEVASWPLFGQLCQEMEMIWVDRSDPESRLAAKQAIAGHVDQWSFGDRPLLVFPEGACSNGRSLKEFKSGIFAPGAEVRPVVIKYTGDWDPANVNFREVLPPSASLGGSSREAKANSAGANGGSGGDSTVYGDAEWARQFFGHIMHSCTVLICRPYKPSDAEQKDPELFKRNVRELMLTRLEELHQREDRKRAENERDQKLPNGIEATARVLLGNVTKGADKARQRLVGMM